MTSGINFAQVAFQSRYSELCDYFGMKSSMFVQRVRAAKLSELNTDLKKNMKVTNDCRNVNCINLYKLKNYSGDFFFGYVPSALISEEDSYTKGITI